MTHDAAMYNTVGLAAATGSDSPSVSELSLHCESANSSPALTKVFPTVLLIITEIMIMGTG